MRIQFVLGCKLAWRHFLHRLVLGAFSSDTLLGCCTTDLRGITFVHICIRLFLSIHSAVNVEERLFNRNAPQPWDQLKAFVHLPHLRSLNGLTYPEKARVSANGEIDVAGRFATWNWKDKTLKWDGFYSEIKKNVLKVKLRGKISKREKTTEYVLIKSWIYRKVFVSIVSL